MTTATYAQTLGIDLETLTPDERRSVRYHASRAVTQFLMPLPHQTYDCIATPAEQWSLLTEQLAMVNAMRDAA